ncbi:MAG: 50S ribosomal protein L22 [Candidatus Daviesbacteria bacterium GW2011_GWA1_41_61]|uniref:50S ribosomal protein L22 n=1 Tax=Candidatus Daviesbacteria bacterium GW2011_GWA2_40_9 TaxID=1618424 RepID=A0A0G0U2J0_9BACT|nr:MAG: 50S ribosomal protein L22 [Candidatus Daviesbacteria bacterium GW2011_GWC1_40_9]KKR83314.1 MAG: 50S ribosomal protein L22 [Candidatus Daviesbacteria bacterium GW2011_GWA2_40_9]KKR93255.1 MAG: 50S ribosomal protein L22 [Candidatus Daviesbacteria bacterium GW2011_GWB1_41_15]KKS14743.1 MAG: 50S ribosomal protein L22 [Candidatus Daviesbacteria bacterium GW2011_GWA1_41_61]
MEIGHTQKYIHTSPRKLKLVADMVRSMEPLKAIKILEMTNKAAALSLAKAIKTAVANARQQKLPEEGLSFKSLEINSASTRRGVTGRFHAQARGRVSPYKKRQSHIRIILSDEGGSNGSKN